MKAYSDANEIISFGHRVPAGLLLIAEAPAKKLRPLITLLASETKEGPGKPGLPWVQSVHIARLTGQCPVTALLRFSDIIKHRLAGLPGWPAMRPEPKASALASRRAKRAQAAA